MTPAVLGLGTAVPVHRYSQAEMAEAASVVAQCDDDRQALLRRLFRETGIGHRHMVHGRDVYGDVVHGTDVSGSPFVVRGDDYPGPDTAERMAVYQREALPLARQAAARALFDADTLPAAVTHLVTVSCTGFAAPGVDLSLIRELELPPTIERTHVGFMGCHGALNGLRVARALALTRPDARVLLCAVELCSLHYYYTWNPKRLVGNALFADGAAALVLGPDGDPGVWRAAASGSCVFPNSEYAMTWTIGNHGFDMSLSARVPSLIAAHLRPWLEAWLASHDLIIRDVGSWAIHPGGPRIVSAIEDALGLNDDDTWASREVLAEFGNMSSPTVLFILDRLRRAAARRPCVALGFGPGLVAEAALLR
jgi:predicted naringenin-chalcone synthase